MLNVPKPDEVVTRSGGEDVGSGRVEVDMTNFTALSALDQNWRP